MHLTLHFVGEVPREQLDDIAIGFAVEVEPFELVLRHHALWSNGIAALEPTITPSGLISLHARLGDAATRLGLPVEQRRYRPHVTLAREAGGSTQPGEMTFLKWRADGYALVESTPDGAYQVLTTYRSATIETDDRTQ
jgi:RNA 2',3'-cyclic 3'-phosphodiesterase